MNGYGKEYRKIMTIVVPDEEGENSPEPLRTFHYCPETDTIFVPSCMPELRAIQAARAAEASYTIANGEVYVDICLFKGMLSELGEWTREHEEALSAIKTAILRTMENSTVDIAGSQRG